MKLAPLLGAALAALAALAAPAYSAGAQDVAITNVTIATGDGGEPVPGGAVVVQGGRVIFAGPAAQMPAVGAATIVDGTGKWVTPGLFAALTTLGLTDADGIEESDDQAARSAPFGAALDVVPALNPASQHVQVARRGGITRASVFARPSGSIFGGQGAVVDLGSDPRMVVRPRAFQMVALGEDGARIAGGSRVAAHALLRNALREARQYGTESRLTVSGRPGRIETGDDVPVDPRLLDSDA